MNLDGVQLKQYNFVLMKPIRFTEITRHHLWIDHIRCHCNIRLCLSVSRFLPGYLPDSVVCACASQFLTGAQPILPHGCALRVSEQFCHPYVFTTVYCTNIHWWNLDLPLPGRGNCQIIVLCKTCLSSLCCERWVCQWILVWPEAEDTFVAAWLNFNYH